MRARRRMCAAVAGTCEARRGRRSCGDAARRAAARDSRPRAPRDEHPANRPPHEPRQPDSQRQVEPDDELGAFEHEVAELAAVGAVDHPGLRPRRSARPAPGTPRAAARPSSGRGGVRRARRTERRGASASARPTVVFPLPLAVEMTATRFTRRAAPRAASPIPGSTRYARAPSRSADSLAQLGADEVERGVVIGRVARREPGVDELSVHDPPPLLAVVVRAGAPGQEAEEIAHPRELGTERVRDARPRTSRSSPRSCHRAGSRVPRPRGARRRIHAHARPRPCWPCCLRRRRSRPARERARGDPPAATD